MLSRPLCHLHRLGPAASPGRLAAILYAELRYGGWYVRGGLAMLADALLARCAAQGSHG
jgi:phytoene dehydrogenase-like protein